MPSPGLEERLILLLARLRPEEETIEKARAIVNSSSRSLDYEKLYRLSAMNGVAMLMYDNLKKIHSVPENIVQRIENLYFLTCRQNILHLRETMRIIGLLQNGGIEVVSLKGAMASDMIFGNLGFYPTSDIDILVRQRDIQRAGSILQEAGYTQTTALNPDDLSSATYHACYSNRDFVIEVHWNLVMRYFTADPDFWWQDTVKTKYEGMDITLLSAERYILYGIFRLFSHAFRPLRFSVFVSALIHTYALKIDWQKLVSCSESLRMKRLVLFTLRLVHDIHGSEIPSSIVNKRIQGYNFFMEYIISEFFSQRQRNHLRMLIFAFLTDTPFDALRVIFGRIFPSLGEIRWRYGLSGKSNMVYIYYILNPFLMLLKRQ